MDMFGGMVVLGLFLLALGCVGAAYDVGRGVAVFSPTSWFPLYGLPWALGIVLVGFGGFISLYEAWENGINRRVDEKLDRCRKTMQSKIQDQYERTLKKRKEE